MLIDAHNHPNWHGHNADKIVANMDEHGIDVTWLLTWECPIEEIGGGYSQAFDARHDEIPFADVAAGWEKYPDRFVPGYAPDPRRPDSQARLKSAVEMYGVRVFGEMKVRVCLNDPDVIDMFHLCGELGLPVTFHMDLPHYPGEEGRPRRIWYCHGFEALEQVLEEVPETNFLGHAPGFWREISGDANTEPSSYPKGPVTPGGRLPALMKKHPNLYGDLSAGSGLYAISRDPEFGRQFLVDFNDRLLFARDYFDGKHMEFIKSCNLPQEVFDNITHKNALRLVPLD